MMRLARAAARRAALRRGLSPTLSAVLSVALLAATAITLPACSKRQTAEPDLLRVRLRHDPPTLDPALSADSSSNAVLKPMFERLVEADPATLELRPGLAERWEISRDGLTYTFHLRPGARFHHERAVEANDVIFSFRRLLRYDRPSPGAEIMDAVEGGPEFAVGTERTIAGLKAIDASTVQIRLAQPYAPFLARLSAIHASIVPRDIYDDAAELYLRRPVGSGPFRFGEWKSSQHLRLLRFEGYAPKPAGLAGIEFRIIQDPTAALEEYRRGGLDILDELPPGATLRAREEFGDQYKIWPLLATTHILINHAAQPLAGNADLRRALNLAVNRQNICDVVMAGLPLPASGILPPGMPGFDASRPAYQENLDEARRLLAKAGVPEGKGLPPLVLLFNASPLIQRLVEQVQIDLARVGVTIELRSADGPGFLQAMASGKLGGKPIHMVRLGWTPDFPDPDAFLGVQLHSRNIGQAGNFSRYRDAEVDRLLDQGRRTLDPARRLQIYRKVEKLAADRDACWLFVYSHRDELLISSRVRGVQPVALGEWMIPYEKLSLGS